MSNVVSRPFNTKEDIRMAAIKLYLNGFIVMVSNMKSSISLDIKKTLERLESLIPQCHHISESLTFWSNVITEEKLEEFSSIVQETESIMNKVNINEFYD